MPAFRGVGSADGALRASGLVAEAAFRDGTTVSLSQRELLSPYFDSNHGTLSGMIRPLILAAPDGDALPPVPLAWPMPDSAARYRLFPGLERGRRRLAEPKTAARFSAWLRARAAEETGRDAGEVTAVRLVVRTWTVAPDGVRSTADAAARTFTFGSTAGEGRR